MSKFQMTNTEFIKLYCLAGNSVVILKSERTSKKLVFRIELPRDNKHMEAYKHIRRFIWFKDGKDWRYVGFLKLEREGKPFVIRKSGAYKSEDTPVKVFNFFWYNLQRNNQIPDGMTVYNKGRCGRCHKPLTDPPSLERGLGPHCAKLVKEEGQGRARAFSRPLRGQLS